MSCSLRPSDFGVTWGPRSQFSVWVTHWLPGCPSPATKPMCLAQGREVEPGFFPWLPLQLTRILEVRMNKRLASTELWSLATSQTPVKMTGGGKDSSAKSVQPNPYLSHACAQASLGSESDSCVSVKQRVRKGGWDRKWGTENLPQRGRRRRNRALVSSPCIFSIVPLDFIYKTQIQKWTIKNLRWQPLNIKLHEDGLLFRPCTLH